MSFGHSAGSSYGAGMRISDIVNTVPVKNRFTNANVEITHDGEGVIWKPEEVKHLPPDYANWFVKKSTLKRNKKGQPTVQSLFIVGGPKDGSPLDVANFEGMQESIERDPNMPTMFDADGTALRPVITTVDTVPGVDQREQKVNAKELEATEANVKATRDATQDKIADAIDKTDVTDEQLERAARLIAEGKGKQAEAGAAE